mmetsp:Transcript_10907/g.12381  ORF Transcript_10907/g.12381 Transcript_10907/m.12381 type:complete len:220 (+) Transcript_10907:60-719(+)
MCMISRRLTTTLTPLDWALITVVLRLTAGSILLQAVEAYFFILQKNPPGAGVEGEIPVKFRESVKIGAFTGGQNGIDVIISQLKESFSGNDYNVVGKNCNHFAEAFCRAMLPEQGEQIFPAYVNRLAWLGSFVPCLFPPENPNSSSPPQAANDSFAAPVNLNSNSNLTNRRAFAGKGIQLGGDAATKRDSTTKSSEPLSSEERRRRIRQATLNRLNKTN